MELNKSNVLAAGVLLIAISLYFLFFQTIPGNPLGGLEETTYKYLMTALFWAGIIVVIVSILIRPRRRIIAPSEAAPSKPSGAVEEGYRKEVAYGGEEAETVEKGGVGLEQAYEEEAPVEESYEAAEEEALEKEEKPGMVGEVIGFCPRCGAPFAEAMRYCRKCGLKVK